jgi:hypothetical protein
MIADALLWGADGLLLISGSLERTFVVQQLSILSHLRIARHMLFCRLEVESMTLIGIALFFGLALFVLALRANLRLREEERLPMQWWLTGEVTWSAPRLIALALIPTLAIFVLTAYILLAENKLPRAGQEGAVLPIMIFIGVMFIAIQLFHLYMIKKTLRGKQS